MLIRVLFCCSEKIWRLETFVIKEKEKQNKKLCPVQIPISVLCFQGYGGYGYPEELQNIALTVDCKPTETNVTVTVFDQSRGEGNKIITTYVEVKACYFAALSGF